MTSLLKTPYIPCTPAGTPLVEFAAVSEEIAWRNLEKQLCPGMYADRAALIARGYEVAKALDGRDHKKRGGESGYSH